MMRSLRAVVVLLCLYSSLLPGQESRGAISGRSMDPSGSNLADVQIRVVNEQMGTAVEVRSNEFGLYAVPYLIPGTYLVSAQASGFKRLDRKGVEVRVGETVTLDLRLTLGEVSESIEVTDSAPLLQRDSASLGAVIDRHSMMELPMAAGNAAELVDLAPGVGRTGSIAIHKAAFNAGTSTLVVNGNTSNANEFTIDGIPNTFASGTLPRVAFSAPSQTVSEFKVQTTFYDAAIGHTMGAVFNMNTKSGTNDMHGEVHYYSGNAAYDATDFFANRAGKGKNSYTDNRYGGAVGGPVLFPKLYNGKNKTFFLYAYDGNKWGALQQYTATVPTAAERDGDFSALTKLSATYQIYNPFTTVAKGDGTFTRSPFPNNVIPASLIQPTARAIMKYFPDPNVAGAANGQNNFVRPTFAAKETYWAHFLRVDQTFSQKSRMFVRLDYDFWDENENHYFGPDNPATGWNDGRTNRGMAIDHVYVLNPSTLFNVRYGITQQDFPGTRTSKGFDLSSLGFSKNLTSLIPASQATFPNIVFTSFAEMGNPNGSPGDGINTSMIHSLAGSATTLKGSHNMHYGVDFRVGRAFQNRYPQQVSPLLRFGTDYTKGPSNTSAASVLGQDLASMLLGIPGGSMQRTASYASQDVWFGAYFQDDWKVTSKLTVNLGLRLEHESPLTERFDRAVRGFDYNAISPIAAQASANYAKSPIPELPVSAFKTVGGLQFVGGANGRQLWDGQAVVILPRVGLAYQVAPRTVLRAGFGLFYDTIGIYRSQPVQTGFTQTTDIISSYDNGLSFVANTANPFPNGLTQPAGAAGGLATGLGQSLTAYPSSRKLPYAERWSFGLQRELLKGFMLDASYVGNHGVRLPLDRAINSTLPRYLSTSPVRDQAAITFLGQVSPNPYYGMASAYTQSISRAALLTPFPQFGGITETQSNGFSHYHALQVQVNKRFSSGFIVNLSYTFSKLMDATAYLNASDAMPWYGISANDWPHRVGLSGTWQLPVGRGKAFASTMPKWLDYAVGGWETAAVITYQSPAPLSWGNVLFNGNIKDIPIASDQRTVDHWFNTSGFVTASNQQLASNIRTFPLRFSGVRGNGQNLWNLSAVKYFPITESVKVQLRGDAYNALNHPNMGGPGVSPTASTFGQVTAMNGYARRMQIAARIIF